MLKSLQKEFSDSPAQTASAWLALLSAPFVLVSNGIGQWSSAGTPAAISNGADAPFRILVSVAFCVVTAYGAAVIGSKIKSWPVSYIVSLAAALVCQIAVATGARQLAGKYFQFA
jgi:hypothetical protein